MLPRESTEEKKLPKHVDEREGSCLHRAIRQGTYRGHCTTALVTYGFGAGKYLIGIKKKKEQVKCKKYCRLNSVMVSAQLAWEVNHSKRFSGSYPLDVSLYLNQFTSIGFPYIKAHVRTNSLSEFALIVHSQLTTNLGF